MLVITDQQEPRDQATALLAYLLGALPPEVLVQRYLDWSQQFEDGGLDLPMLCLRYPWLIGTLEPFGGAGSVRQQSLKRCLVGALSILEASPVGAKILVEGNHRHPLLTVLSIFAMGVVELLILPVRVVTTLLRLL